MPSTAPPIVYDGLRLFLGAMSATPRGIDRVDLSYARFLCENWPGEFLGLLPMPWGIRLYDRARSSRVLETLQASWREDQQPHGDPAFTRLRHWLTETPAAAHPASSPPRFGSIRRGLRFLQHNGLHLGHSAIAAAPRNAIYLNIGQMGWAAPVTTHWLRRRPDMRAVFMLHDVIPIQHPGLVSNGGRLSHNWMLRSVLHNSTGLITTTQSASDTVVAELRRLGRPGIKLRAIPLPVAEVFRRRDPPDEDLSRTPYFVICGAIEPRKNHLMLLRVWQRLVQRIGSSAPRLVVIGTPAHQGRQIVRSLLEGPQLRNHLTVVSGLTSPSLRKLLASAQALLMPSLAEGFGLPVIEALTVGTPVLASDLPSLRESGDGLAIYLDPSDEVAWFDAILNIVETQTETAALRKRVGQYRPIEAADYFNAVSEFLTSFA